MVTHFPIRKPIFWILGQKWSPIFPLGNHFLNFGSEILVTHFPDMNHFLLHFVDKLITYFPIYMLIINFDMVTQFPRLFHKQFVITSMVSQVDH